MAKPEIGLSMLYCLDEPFKSLMKHLAEASVKHIELTDEGLHTLNKKRVKKLRQVAEAHNLDFVVHAPWAGMNIASPNPILRRTIMKRLKKSIAYARQLDCRLWLFHPGSKTGLSYIYIGKDWQQNLISVRDLLKVARREGIEIAIENGLEPHPFLMKSVQDFHRFYDDLGDEIGIVLDVGHANLNNQISDFIQQFSKKLAHIHASDNNGDKDMHLGIGYGSIDWEKVANLVKEAEYGNIIMIESTENLKESVQFFRQLFI
jgi:sugar phosphate isomerase/epimerase